MATLIWDSSQKWELAPEIGKVMKGYRPGRADYALLDENLPRFTLWWGGRRNLKEFDFEAQYTGPYPIPNQDEALDLIGSIRRWASEPRGRGYYSLPSGLPRAQIPTVNEEALRGLFGQLPIYGIQGRLPLAGKVDPGLRQRGFYLSRHLGLGQVEYLKWYGGVVYDKPVPCPPEFSVGHHNVKVHMAWEGHVKILALGPFDRLRVGGDDPVVVMLSAYGGAEVSVKDLRTGEVAESKIDGLVVLAHWARDGQD